DTTTLHLYIEGEQAAAADFAALVTGAVQSALTQVPGLRDLAPALPVEEVEHEDEDTGAVLAPVVTGLPPEARELAPAATVMPTSVQRPRPPATTLHGCPAGGDGHDKTLNNRKNRTDKVQWTAVALSAIIGLGWPEEIERRLRTNWPPAATAAVAKYEGMPIQ